MFLSNAAVNNRVTVLVLIFLIVLLGGYSYLTLPREAAPDIPIPIILVTTVYEGVSPEDVETSVTLKIEKELSGLKGLKELRSSSAEGISVITIEFLPEVSTEDALQYVRDKVDLAKAELPVEAEDPALKEVNFAEFPILMIDVSGDVSPVRLKAVADTLEDTLEEIQGVLNVDVMGALEREIRLEVHPDRAAAYGLTLDELLALIPSENVNISAGGMETEGTKFNVRVPAEFVDPEEVDSLVLTMREGKPIYLTDVCTVRDTFKDRESYARLDGTDSISVAVRKRVGANIIVISDAVKSILEEFRRRAPEGMKFEITLDMSKDIRAMVNDLENNIVSGLVLVMVVLVLFLGFRTSAIVAFAIPMSMLISFAAIKMLGYTLNMIVLFSLILALGMLVDNAIVIVENIYRHTQLGLGRIEAAMKGAAEVAWPVATSTATTLAAFGPMLFWPGIMGEFMGYLPLTLIITLSSSLFVALVISPTVCSVFGKAGKPVTRRSLFVRVYRFILSTALNHRYVTLALAGLLLLGLGNYYSKYNYGVELFPDFDPRRAVVNIRCPQGTSIEETNRLAMKVEEKVQPYVDEMQHVVTNVGSSGSAAEFSFGTTGGPHVANLTLVFEDYIDRERSSAETVKDVREAVSDLSGAEIKVEKEKAGPPTGAPVTVRIMGEDFDVLKKISEKAKRLISGVPGMVNLRSDFEASKPELAFIVDRRRAYLNGVNSAVIGNFLKTAIFGTKVGTYRQFNEEYDITVRLPKSQRVNIEDLFRLRVPNRAGEYVPLSSLGEFEYRAGLGTVNRVNQKRTITLSADNEDRKSEDVLADVQRRLAELDLPEGYALRYAGEKEELDKAEAFLSKAFVVALLLITLILVAQFNTFSAPLIIMTTVVLSLAGVLGGLLFHHMPFGVIMTGIGVISLAGVVVNNAIVLLDYTRRLQRRGRDLLTAAIDAGTTRLRPVLLTATTTILGLVPMATGMSFDFHTFEWAWKSESSQWWSAMAIAVIYGLAFATVLTLVIVPTLYVTIYKFAAALGFGGLEHPVEKERHRREEEAEAPPA